MSPLRRDLDDEDDSLFGAERAKERREQIEAQARALAEVETRILAAAAKSRDEFGKWERERLWRDYREAGVEPLSVLPNGAPGCSLALLLSVGCTIEDLGGGERKLVVPARKKLTQGKDGIWA